MLLAVEGGGFFSSSAYGYSKGLTLLLWGRKDEERPMKVSPWNQYQLVERETNSELQLASGKNQVSSGCASFICFGRTSAEFESPHPPKVGPIQQLDISAQPPVSEKGEDCITEGGNDCKIGEVYPKGNLKRSSNCVPIVCGDDNFHQASSETGVITIEKRVQWTDTCGKELVEIREFEQSDDDASDEESAKEKAQKCLCVIM